MTNRALAAFLLGGGFVLAAPAHAGDLKVTTNVDYRVSLLSSESDLHRLHVSQKYKKKLSKKLKFESEWKFDLSGGDVGVGDFSNYSSISKPLIRTDNAKLEINEFKLQYRLKDGYLTVGKQVIPWGVLDSIRITDIVNPVRLNEFVFIEDRPDRIGLWSARLRGTFGGMDYDLVFAPDPTVHQFAKNGAAFFPKAPRLRGGLPVGASLPRLKRDGREESLKDALYAIRLGKKLKDAEVHFAIISGPAQMASLELSQTAPEVLLKHNRQTTFGGDMTFNAGKGVFRGELAFTPDYQVNGLAPNGTPVIDEVKRFQIGLGYDWRGEGGSFYTTQIFADHVIDEKVPMVRPEQDVITTFRSQREFSEGYGKINTEIIYSLTDQDGAFRGSVEYLLNDQITSVIGADIPFGDESGLFGQFEEQRRLWVGLRATF